MWQTSSSDVLARDNRTDECVYLLPQQLWQTILVECGAQFTTANVE
jgi:hypothetical protein